MLLAYLIIITFPLTPADKININIVGRFPVEMCESLKSSIPDKPNRLVVCSNIRDL